MAKLHCRYCGDHKTDHSAGFASIYAYDRHLIAYRDMERSPFPGYSGRPVCVGQRDGEAFTDPHLLQLRAQGHSQKVNLARSGAA